MAKEFDFELFGRCIANKLLVPACPEHYGLRQNQFNSFSQFIY
jgi:hypothetical protein